MKEVIVASFPLIGVFIGAMSSMIGGYLANRNKIETLNQEFDQNKKIELRQQYLIRLEQYSKILKADGENEVDKFDDTIGSGKFNCGVYQESIRPLIFEKLHMLDEDVIKSAREIDRGVAHLSMLYHPGELESHLMDLASDYYGLIQKIERHIFVNSVNISSE